MIQFSLRAFRSGDVQDLVKHANNYGVSKNLTNKFPFPYLESDGITFIEWTLSHEPLMVKAIVVNDEVVGSIGIHPLADIYAKNAELGYWIGEAFWGKGIVALAVTEMLDYGFQTFDVDRIFARTTNMNIASQRVLAKTAFVFEAELKGTIFKNGDYFDELIFGFRKSQWETK